MKKNQMANTVDNNAGFKLCLYNGGIDPTSLSSCIRGSTDQASLQGCLSPEKLPIMKRCALEADAEAQARTHTTNCYTDILGTHCTSN